MSATEAREPWVGPEVVAAHLGFEEDHIRVMARSGELPGVKMGSGKRQFWRFKLSQVDEWMERRAKAQQEEAVRITIRQAMPTMSAIVDMAKVVQP